jgi:hypothetical protein
MKKLILSLIALATICFNAEAQAADPQTFGVATEGQSFEMSFTYPSPLLPIKLLNNGVDFRDFTLSAITVVSTSGNLITAKMTITPLVRGIYNLQAVAMDPVLGRSPPSNICTVTNLHVAPGQWKKLP